MPTMTRHIAIPFLLFVCLALSSRPLAAADTLNLVRERVYHTAVRDESLGRPLCKSIYYDGLGRAVQTVSHTSGSPVSTANYTEYDSRGRVIRQWLPAAAGDNDGGFVPLAELRSCEGSGPHAFSIHSYEASPPGRLTETRGAGRVRHEAPGGVATTYRFNQASGLYSCRKAVMSGGKVKFSGTYPSGELRVTEVTDEDGNRAVSFADGRGQTILSRQIPYGGTAADTYFVYDTKGQLILAMPPSVSALLSSGGEHSLDSPSIKQRCHQYAYDEWGRCVTTVTPGGIRRMAATPSGNLSFSQDAVQAAGGKMLYTLYDGCGREVCRGLMELDGSGTYESVCGTHSSNRTSYSDSASGILFGYAKTRAIQNPDGVLSLEYYDDYRFLSRFPEAADSLGFLTVNGCSDRGDIQGSFFKTAGHRTGSVRRVIGEYGDSLMLVTAYYYDSRGRLVQQRCTNHLGGTDTESFRLTFDGRPEYSVYIHTSAGGTRRVEEREYSYTGLLQPLSVRTRVDGGAWVVTTTNGYDALGRLASTAMIDGRVPVSYGRTPEGELERITSPAFSQTLYRETRPGGAAGYLNGSISGQEFRLCAVANSSNAALSRELEAAYDYTYQGGRLTRAAYTEASRVTPSRGISFDADLHASPDYSASYTYDADGNPLRIIRKGITGESVSSPSPRRYRFEYSYGTTDDLSLAYTDGRLSKVTDSGTDPDMSGSTAFTDGADKDIEYTYDLLGRMTSDRNKDVSSVSYNDLGLPSAMSHGKTRTYYTYLSDGTLLARRQGVDKLVAIAPETPYGVMRTEIVFEEHSRRDYVGPCVYTDGSLERVFHECGWSDGSGRHTAVIRDYQGNTRATWTQGDEVLSTQLSRKSLLYRNLTAYYPYGLPFADWQGEERYLYSGKELERGDGLMHYDFHARQYDPHLGLFTSPDPLSGDYPALSSYLYCAGNPVMFTDPTGMIITDELKKAIDPLFLLAGVFYHLKVNLNLMIQVKSMFDVLNESSQIYDFEYDSTLRSNMAATKYNYNKDKNEHRIVLYLSVENNNPVALIAHELVHMYQFETGKISFSYDKDGWQKPVDNEFGFLHDLTDELEAYNMGVAFGGRQVTLEGLKKDELYSNLSPMFKSVETYIKEKWDPSLPMTEQNIKNIFTGWADVHQMVFRYNNQLYIPYREKKKTQKTIEQQNENTKMVNNP